MTVDAHGPGLLTLTRFEPIPDSAGPDRFRGGSGVRRDLRFLAEDRADGVIR